MTALPALTAAAASPAAAATPGRTVVTAGALPADAFITRSGSTLLLDGKPWRFSGANMYWLGLDDNLRDADGPTYPAHGRIDDGFGAARTLGARVVRSHTLGISVGTPRSIEPTLGTFNDAAFDTIDYAVASARRNGIRLMVPLTDQWQYYHGGKHTFTAWRGHPDLPGQNAATSDVQKATEALFYTDPAVVGDFQSYVGYVLDHVNPYTGLRLGSDPTIAVWETGNELWDAPPTWTQQTARFIKSRAPRALVADGSAATGMHVAAAALTAPDVDIVGGHFYPTDATWAATDAKVAAASGKAYVVGEYPLVGADVTGWLSGLAADRNVTGDLAWTLLPRMADGTPEPHGDGYAFHNPGATDAERTQVAALTAHAAAMSPPTVTTVTAAPSAPVNLMRTPSVATTAAGPAAYVTGSTGPTSAVLAVGAPAAGLPTLRVTARSAGYGWVYPGRWTDGAPVVPARTYTGTVAVHRLVGRPGPAATVAHLTWYDATGRYLSGSDGPATALTAQWQATSVTAVAPAGAAFAVPQWQTPAPGVTGDVVELGRFGISAGTSASPWRIPGV